MKYALIKEGWQRVFEVVDQPFEVNKDFQWVECADETSGKTHIYKDGGFVSKVLSDQEIAESNLQWLRIERDKKLNASDWTQMPDVDLTSTQKTEWANYRQALRDITESFQSQSDEGFAWPTEPSA